MSNPYAPPPAIVDSRPWFSGVPRWIKWTAGIIAAVWLSVTLAGLVTILVNADTLQAAHQPGTTFFGDEIGPEIDRVVRKWIDPPS